MITPTWPPVKGSRTPNSGSPDVPWVPPHPMDKCQPHRSGFQAGVQAPPCAPEGSLDAPMRCRPSWSAGAFRPPRLASVIERSLYF